METKENIMPTVNGKKYSYTKKGKEEAKQARAKKGKPAAKRMRSSIKKKGAY